MSLLSLGITFAAHRWAAVLEIAPRVGVSNTRRDNKEMKLKVDTSAVSFMCTKTPEPRTDFGTGQPKIDKATGAVLYQVQLMALDADGGDMLAVTVAGEPKVTVGQQVSVTNLVATPWSQDGRSGVAFRADAITNADGKAAQPRT